MTNLVIAGHSFGGITAMQVAKQKLVKAAICLDPWYLPVNKEVTDTKTYKFDKTMPPTMIINTSEFPQEMVD